VVVTVTLVTGLVHAVQDRLVAGPQV
jgi:hypothetical protein